MSLSIAVSMALRGGGVLGPSLAFDFTKGDLRSTAGGVTPSMTRATTRTIIDWEGRICNILLGEVPFYGMRRVCNRIGNTSTDFTNAAWVKGGVSVSYSEVLDGLPATRITLSGGLTGHTCGENAVIPSGSRAWISFAVDVTNLTTKVVAIEINDGVPERGLFTWTGPQTISGNMGAGMDWAVRIIGDYKAVIYTLCSTTIAAANIRLYIGNYGNYSGDGEYVIATRAMVEVVDGQSNQNPSEYVSVGALAAPYHGAAVDGVKYFTTLNGNTVSSNVVTEATGAAIPLAGVGHGVLPDGGSNTFTTPNSSANQITGDIDFRWFGIFHTTAQSAYLINKDDGSGDRAYNFWVNGGNLNFFAHNGGTNYTAAATVSLATAGYVVGTLAGFRCTRQASTGNVNFYWSTDNGSTWVQVGAANVATTAGNFAATTENLRLGGTGSTASPITVYKAQLYNGIAGTKVAEFIADDWASGGTFVSSTTGETWTLNGGAAIRKWPIQGYFPEAQSANLCLQSENFGTTWSTVSSPTRSAAALRCGSVVLDLIGDDAAGAVEGYAQVVTFTGNAVKARSFFIAQGTATSSVFRINDSTATAVRLLGAITWVNGIPTVTMTTGTLLGVDALGNGVFRVRVASTSITAANTNIVEVYPATDAALAVGGTGTIYWGGEQAENAVVCSSYIPTTTATATRNADVMSATTGAWFNAIEGTVVMRFFPPFDANGRVFWALNNGTANEELNAQCNASPQTNYVVTDGGVAQANIATVGKPTAAVVGAGAWAYALNDFAQTMDGGALGTDAAGTLPTVTTLNIGHLRSTNIFSGGIRSLAYYNKRLLNATLQGLTA